jgi:hypothetical protein
MKELRQSRNTMELGRSDALRSKITSSTTENGNVKQSEAVRSNEEKK